MNSLELKYTINSHIDSGNIRAAVMKHLQNVLTKSTSKSKETVIVLEGLESFNQGDRSGYKKAMEKFKRLRDFPELLSIQVYFISTCHFFLDEISEGIDYLKGYIGNVDARLDLVHESLGFYYNTLGNYKDAIDEFDKAIALNSKRTPLCLWGKGHSYNFQCNYKNAVTCFEGSCSGELEIRTQSRLEIAEVYSNTGQFEKSLQVCDDVLQEFIPVEMRIDFIRRKIEILGELRRFDEAYATFLSGLSIELNNRPEKGYLICDYVRCLILRKEYGQALKLVDDSIENRDFRESKVQLLLLKSEICDLQGDFKNAEKWLSKIDIENLSKSVKRSVFLAQAKFYKNQKRWPSALRAVEGVKQNSHSLLSKTTGDLEEADIYKAQNRTIEAKKMFEKIALVGSADQKCRAFFELARISHQTSQTDDAIQSLEKAIQYANEGINLASCLQLKGKIARTKKQYKLAMELFEKSMAAYPVAYYSAQCLKESALTAELQNDQPAALKFLKLATSLPLEGEDKAEALLNLAFLQGKMPNQENAALNTLHEIYDLSVSSDTKSLAQFKIGEIYLLNESYPEALTAFQHAATLETDDDFKATIKFKEGYSHYKMQSMTDAVYCFEQVFTNETNDPLTPALLLAIALKRSSPELKEITRFDRLLKSENAEFKNYGLFAQGFFLHLIGETKSAIEKLNEVKFPINSPAYGYYHYIKARTYLEASDTKNALTAALVAETHVSTNSAFYEPKKIFEILSTLYTKKEQHQLSRQYLEKAIAVGSREATSIFEIDERISESSISKSDNESYDIKLPMPIEKLNLRPQEERKKYISKAPKANHITAGFELPLRHGELLPHIDSSSEYACHYTKAETALFYILPSVVNHKYSFDSAKVSLRFNPIGNVNDIEEGEFKLADSEQNQFAQQKFEKLKKAIKSEIKVFCVSWNNSPVDEVKFAEAPFLIPPMWSRYGDRHAGISIIFDLKQLKSELDDVCKTSNIRLTKFQRVIYAYPQKQNGITQAIPSTEMLEHDHSIDLDKFFRNGTSVNDKRINALFFKPPHWNYEKEYRLLLHYPTHDPLDLTVSTKVIKGIVLGKEVKKGFTREIQNICKKYEWFLFEYNPTASSIEHILKAIK
ncbi:DUF2971 domain-containing protein [Bdellovibrio sp. HCB274]|uniref:DUF2971 domain-containing protein n=1 Tax=Bdellovibrio sp. HCB274 TaxID=3394361 RepID=UPI0039B44877